MLKFSICLLVLVSNLLIAQAQTADYSESSMPVAREYKVEKKSKKEKKETEKISAPVAVNVSVPVTVVDQKGVFVDDLTAADFKVFVDDAEVKNVVFLRAENQPLNIIFLFDVSPSTESVFAEMKKFIGRIIENSHPSDKIAFVTFDADANMARPLTGDRALLTKSLAKIDAFGGGTALYDAVGNVFNKRLPIGEKTVVVMLTDGVDTVSQKYDYEKSLDVVRKHDVPVTTFYFDTLADALDPKKWNKPVQIGGAFGYPGMSMKLPPMSKREEERLKYEALIGRNYLSDLATTSGGSTINISDYSKLTDNQVRGLSNLIRPQYYLAFEADTAKPQGRIRIRVNRPQLKVNARSRY